MPNDDPIARLLADEVLLEALRFCVLSAYASGWSDAFGAPLVVADARLAELVEEAGATWQNRLIARRPIMPRVEPPPPPWLAALQEGHTPEPWGES